MDPLTHEDFSKFLEYYEDKTCIDDNGRICNCYDKIDELSRSDTDRADSLVRHRQKMYGLDRMVLYSKKFNEERPKSTDAIFFRLMNDGHHALHIIEFKFLGYTHTDRVNALYEDMNKKISCENFQNLNNNNQNDTVNNDVINDELNDDSENSPEDCENDECFSKDFISNLKKVKKDFEDPIKVSLQLKPYEAIFITLPMLYEEYCEETNITKKDIYSYLRDVDKYYWAVVGNFSTNDTNIHYKVNELNAYSSRLEMTIFKKASVIPREGFKEVLEKEILETFNYRLF